MITSYVFITLLLTRSIAQQNVTATAGTPIMTQQNNEMSIDQSTVNVISEPPRIVKKINDIFISMPSQLFMNIPNEIIVQNYGGPIHLRLVTEPYYTENVIQHPEQYTTKLNLKNWYDVTIPYYVPFDDPDLEKRQLHKIKFLIFFNCLNNTCENSTADKIIDVHYFIKRDQLLMLGTVEKLQYVHNETVNAHFVILPIQNVFPFERNIKKPVYHLDSLSSIYRNVRKITSESNSGDASINCEFWKIIDANGMVKKQRDHIQTHHSIYISYEIGKHDPSGDWLIQLQCQNMIETVKFTVKTLDEQQQIFSYMIPPPERDLHYESAWINFRVCGKSINGLPIIGQILGMVCICPEASKFPLSLKESEFLLKIQTCPSSKGSEHRKCVSNIQFSTTGCVNFKISTGQFVLRYVNTNNPQQLQICYKIYDTITGYNTSKCEFSTLLTHSRPSLKIYGQKVYRIGLPNFIKVKLTHPSLDDLAEQEIQLDARQITVGCTKLNQQIIANKTKLVNLNDFDSYFVRLKQRTDKFGIVVFSLPPIRHPILLKILISVSKLYLFKLPHLQMHLNDDLIFRQILYRPWPSLSGLVMQIHFNNNSSNRFDCVKKIYPVKLLTNFPLKDTQLWLEYYLGTRHKIIPINLTEDNDFFKLQTHCEDHDDAYGHYKCIGNQSVEEIQCLDGWQGDDCLEPICSDSCHPIGGFCLKPGECECKTGWFGENCENCDACYPIQCYSPMYVQCICETPEVNYTCSKLTKVRKQPKISKPHRTIYVNWIPFYLDESFNFGGRIIYYFYAQLNAHEFERVVTSAYVSTVNCGSPGYNYLKRHNMLYNPSICYSKKIENVDRFEKPNKLISLPLFKRKVQLFLRPQWNFPEPRDQVETYNFASLHYNSTVKFAHLDWEIKCPFVNTIPVNNYGLDAIYDYTSSYEELQRIRTSSWHIDEFLPVAEQTVDQFPLIPYNRSEIENIRTYCLTINREYLSNTSTNKKLSNILIGYFTKPDAIIQNMVSFINLTVEVGYVRECGLLIVEIMKPHVMEYWNLISSPYTMQCVCPVSQNHILVGLLPKQIGIIQLRFNLKFYSDSPFCTKFKFYEERLYDYPFQPLNPDHATGTFNGSQLIRVKPKGFQNNLFIGNIICLTNQTASTSTNFSLNMVFPDYKSCVIEDSIDAETQCNDNLLGPVFGNLIERLIFYPNMSTEQFALSFKTVSLIVNYLNQESVKNIDWLQHQKSYFIRLANSLYDFARLHQMTDGSYSSFGRNDETLAKTVWLSALLQNTFFRIESIFFKRWETNWSSFTSSSISFILRSSHRGCIRESGHFFPASLFGYKNRRGRLEEDLLTTAYVIISFGESYGTNAILDYSALDNALYCLQSYIEKPDELALFSNYLLSLMTYAFVLTKPDSSITQLIFNYILKRSQINQQKSIPIMYLEDDSGIGEPFKHQSNLAIESTAYLFLSLYKYKKDKEDVRLFWIVNYLSFYQPWIILDRPTYTTTLTLQVLCEFSNLHVPPIENSPTNKVACLTTTKETHINKLIKTNGYLSQMYKLNLKNLDFINWKIEKLKVNQCIHTQIKLKHYCDLNNYKKFHLLQVYSPFNIEYKRLYTKSCRNQRVLICMSYLNHILSDTFTGTLILEIIYNNQWNISVPRTSLNSVKQYYSIDYLQEGKVQVVFAGLAGHKLAKIRPIVQYCIKLNFYQNYFIENPEGILLKVYDLHKYYPENLKILSLPSCRLNWQIDSRYYLQVLDERDRADQPCPKCQSSESRALVLTEQMIQSVCNQTGDILFIKTINKERFRLNSQVQIFVSRTGHDMRGGMTQITLPRPDCQCAIPNHARYLLAFSNKKFNYYVNDELFKFQTNFKTSTIYFVPLFRKTESFGQMLKMLITFTEKKYCPNLLFPIRLALASFLYDW